VNIFEIFVFGIQNYSICFHTTDEAHTLAVKHFK
jgi:hypothetical protein